MIRSSAVCSYVALDCRDNVCVSACVCVFVSVQMLLVYGFIDEPRLLLHGGGGGPHTHVRPTSLTRQLAKSQPGLLVAGMVALHENNKAQLEQADHIFKVCVCVCVCVCVSQCLPE